MSEHKLGKKCLEDFKDRRKESQTLLSKFLQIADLAMLLVAEVSFEWPRFCAGWALPELQKFIQK